MFLSLVFEMKNMDGLVGEKAKKTNNENVFKGAYLCRKI